MPGLGLGHWWILLIIAALALIIFGPQRLPELGAGLGRAIREFRKGAAEMTESLKEEASKPADHSSTDHAPGSTYPPAEPVKTSAQSAGDTPKEAAAPAEPVTPTEAPKG